VNPYETPTEVSAESTPSPEQYGHRAARDFGIASLIMAAALFLMAPLALILVVQIWAHGDRTPGVVMLHAWLARLGCPAILTVGVASVWLGFAGSKQAKREHTSSVLPLAGLFFGIVAILMWIIAAIGVLNTTESMVHLFA